MNTNLNHHVDNGYGFTAGSDVEAVVTAMGVEAVVTAMGNGGRHRDVEAVATASCIFVFVCPPLLPTDTVASKCGCHR